AVDAAGNLGRATPFDFADGTINGVQLLAGKRFLLKDNQDPSRRRLRWLARDARVTLPPPVSDRPTVAGATLLLLNPTTGETASVVMPATGWTQQANGFRYKDPGTVNGAVQRALVRGGKLVKLVAKGSGIGFTLDEPSQGSLGVVLTIGGSRYCTLFGGVRTD